MTPNSSAESRGAASLQHGQAGRDIIVVAGNYHAGPASAATSLHQLPSPPRDFTGRVEELDDLLVNLGKGGVHIYGMGGVGKTALALKLAEQLAPRYPAAQFYLDLKGASAQPLSTADAMLHVIRAYDPTAKSPESDAELCARYRSVLHAQSALLLMDNAKDAAQVEPLTPPETCLLIVTSRPHFILPGLFCKDLDTPPPEDARAFLLKIAPRIGDEADELARLCGYLPLALRLAASALAERRDLSADVYVRRLSDAKQRLKLMEASLTLSYNLLQPEQQKLWRTLAVFPNTFDARAAAAVWEIEQDAAQDSLSELVRYSILEWDDTTARYSLHDLARLCADARLSEEERSTIQKRHAEHYLRVLSGMYKLYRQGGDDLMRGLALFDLERANIETGQSWAEKHADEDHTAAELCSSYPVAGAYFFSMRHHPRERIRCAESALAAARKLGKRSAEGRHLGSLGLAYADLGEARRAIEFYEQRLAIAREVGDRRGECKVLSSMGNAYRFMGDLPRAIELHEQSLVIARELGDQLIKCNTLGSLGITYADLGETPRAIELYEEALVIARKIGDRRSEGNVLDNLGNAYASSGETRRAIEFYEKSLAINRKTGNRRTEGKTLGNLGVTYDELGDTHRAIELYEQCLAIAREISDRRGEGTTLWNMSLALNDLGNRAQAIAHAEAALKIREELEDPRADKVRKKLAGWRGQA